MAWTPPVDRSPGYFVLDTDWNAVQDNMTVLRTAGFALASQAVGDLLSASSATQYSRIAIGAAGKIFRTDGTNPGWSTPTYPNTATSGKVLVGDGTNIVLSTPTFPNASATSGKVITSDGTNWIASTATYPATTTANQILYSSSTSVIGEITTAASSVLITSAGSVPSLSQTLPSAVQGNIATVGTITSGVWNAGAVTSSGQITSTVTNFAFVASGASTTYRAIHISNTSGDMFVGVNDSVGSGTITGGNGYAAVVTSNNSTPLDFGTNGVRRGGFAATNGNFDITGLLTVNGNGLHTFGTGGTGSTTPTIVINGGTASNNGSLIQFQKNSVAIANVGASSASAGGTSNALELAGLTADGTSIYATHASGAIRFYAGGTTLTTSLSSTGWSGMVTIDDVKFSGSADAWTAYDGVGGTAYAWCIRNGGHEPSLGLLSMAGGTGRGGGQLIAGRNTSGSGASGCILITGLGGASNYLWVDGSAAPGMLRISNTINLEDGGTTSDLHGTIVGTQTSTRRSKEPLSGDWATSHTRIAPSDAFAAMIAAPVFDYYKSNRSYGGTLFTNTTIDDAPWIGMDPDELNPDGRSFNPETFAGYTMLGFRHVDARVAALEATLTQLKQQSAIDSCEVDR